MQKSCLQCTKTFEITNEDLAFYKKVSPRFNDKTYEIPPPKLCPDCRQQRRLAFRNERKLYQRKCDLCQKNVISVCKEESDFPVYCQECWYSDHWSGLDFGQNFDFNQPFFVQFQKLKNKIPRWSKIVANSENCEYCINCDRSKNCYLVASSFNAKDCFYSNRLFDAQDNCDCLNIETAELTYECIDSERLNDCAFIQNSKGCSNCSFCFDCINCQNCFMCTGLRNTEYQIFNKKYSKTEYLTTKQKLLEKGFSKLQKDFDIFCQNNPQKNQFIFNSENCHGDFIFNSKNIQNGFFVRQSENSKNIQDSRKTDLSLDCSYGDFYTECFETTSSYDCNQVHFSDNVGFMLNCFYCTTSLNCTNCFGCIGLKKKQYCILNKQYTKEEYEELVPKIIEHMKSTGEWGEFFPVELSPFAYNETVAQEYFPMTKEEVLAKGWKWKDEEDKIPEVSKIIPAERLPDSIEEIPDDVLNWAIKCEKTGRPFKIQKSELEFYRKMNLPIPHFHPDVRHEMRMAKRNPRKLWTRNCAECQIEIETTYAPDRSKKVLCEKCYLKEVN